ncbi:hypothetical protein ACJX0J_028978 [Zea mays]
MSVCSVIEFFNQHNMFSRRAMTTIFQSYTNNGIRKSLCYNIIIFLVMKINIDIVRLDGEYIAIGKEQYYSDLVRMKRSNRDAISLIIEVAAISKKYEVHMQECV